MILGLNAHAHDAGIALLEDGSPTFVLEEERVNRIKKTTAFPTGAIGQLRRRHGIGLRDIQEIAFPWRGGRFLATIGRQILRDLPFGLHLLRPGASPNMNVAAALRFLRVGAQLGRAFESPMRLRVRRVSHHLAHASNAFFLSPFDTAAVLVMDAYGDDCSTSAYQGCGTTLQLLRKNTFFDSVGILYSMVTKHLGFRTILDEGSVMALAAYGTDALYPAFRDLIELLPDGRYGIARRFFDYHRYGEMRPVSAAFTRAFGAARHPGEPLTQRHMDIAHALQRLTEETILHIARWLHSATGERTLCFGGGLALNCLTNARLARETGFDRVYVSPNPSDAGVALGAALAAHYGVDRPAGMAPVRQRAGGGASPYLGVEYDEAAILDALRRADLTPEPRDDVAQVAARELAQGRIVCWFQGRGEAGPRALGNRSILGDPRDPFLPNKLNETVKHRAWFRPYAPSVLEERATEFFRDPSPSPHMSFAAAARSEARDIIPAVLARDGSARIHTVSPDQNPLFHELLTAFDRLTGIPMVLNTSFNAQEPVVFTPSDAVRLFLNSGADVLIAGQCVVRKAPDHRAVRRSESAHGRRSERASR